MTFIWTEISFLALWWQSAHPTRKVNLKKLVDEGMVFGFTCTFVFYRIEFSILLICVYAKLILKFNLIFYRPV